MNLSATHKVVVALAILAVLGAGTYLKVVQPTVLEMAVAAFLGWLAPSPMRSESPGSG